MRNLRHSFLRNQKMFSREIKKRDFSLADAKDILLQDEWKKINLMRVNKSRVEEILACEDFVSVFYFEPFWDQEWIDILLNKLSIVEICTSSKTLFEILKEEFSMTRAGSMYCLHRKSIH